MKEKGVFISLINKLMLRMKMLARKRGEILKQTDRKSCLEIDTWIEGQREKGG